MLIAIVAASLVALICFILIIVFVVWRCRSIKKKDGKKPLENGFYNKPTILMQHPPMIMPAGLKKTPQQLQVYAVPMPEQIDPKRASLISKQQSKKDKQPKRVWQNSIQTQSHSFVWRPIKPESGRLIGEKNKAAEEIHETISDRQREPHRGSIRYLPSRKNIKK